MARILVVYKEFPAPAVGHAGGQAVFRLIEFLQRRGHSIYLVTRLRRKEEPLVEATRSLCVRLETTPHHDALPGPRPLAWLRSYLALRRVTARVLRQERPDAVFVEFTQTAMALLGMRLPRATIRPHDLNWYLLEQRAGRQRGLRRWLTRAVARGLRGFEPWVCRRYAVVAAISEGDRRLLAPHCRRRAMVVVPLAPIVVSNSAVEPAVPPGLNVLFVAAMYRAPNVQAAHWFLQQVWPQVLAAAPQARFLIVGYGPPPEIEAYHDGERVWVTGFVDDLTPWYRAAAVVVSPLQVGGGLLQKVVDALSLGVPVVATTVSNHGVAAVAGEQLLVADDPAEFAAAVVRLLHDPAQRERLARAGQDFARQQYDLEEAIVRWEVVALAG